MLSLAPMPATARPLVATRPAAGPSRRSLALPLLLLLTLIAGGLRFVSLDRPSVWGDEAQTYGRIGGTYGDLLDQLASSSFPPLHYELEWWIGQGLPYWGHVEPPPAGADADAPARFVPTKFLVPGGVRLTPFVLRFVPALAGTLFVPAIYFLARQLFGRRVALTAAFLACFSAYALVYSRDAKMYMHFWLCVTVHVACLLWWLRTRRAVAWAAWAAAGVAMVGLHGSGFFMLPIEGLVVLTTPGAHWRKTLTLAGFVGWGLLVLPATAAEAVRCRLGGAASRRWERFVVWPRRAWRAFVMPPAVAFLAGVGLMLAAPLGPLGYYSAFSEQIHNANREDQARLNVNEIGIGWVGPYNAGRGLGDDLLYTASAFLTGWEWPRHFPDIGIDDARRVNVRTLRLLQGGTAGLLALLAVGLVPWRKAFARARARLDRATQDRRVFGPFRGRRVLWLGVWLTALPWVTYTQSNDRPANVFDGVAAVALRHPPDVHWPRAEPVLLPTPPAAAPADGFFAGLGQTWRQTRDALADRWTLVRRTAADTARQWPPAWRQYAAAFRRDDLSVVGLSLAAGVAACVAVTVLLGWRRLWRGTVVLAVVATLLPALGMLLNLLPRWINNDLWLPRYLGTVFPAVLVIAAVLIDRQPRWLRGVTLGLFVVVNAAQFSARVWGQSEPPTALMAADVVASQPRSIVAGQPDVVPFRAYTAFGPFRNGEPGGGTLATPAGRYYLRLLSGVPGDVRGVRGEGAGPYEQCLNVWEFNGPGLIAGDLARSPQVRRFVVWTGLPPGDVDQTDPLADLLKGRFRRVGEELWAVRDHWRWVERYQVRRRTYERIGR